jgi:adenylate cyclase 3
MTEDPGSVCLYPSYFSYFCVLVLVAASLPAQVSHLVKASLLFLITATHCCMNVLVIGPALDSEEATNHRDWTKLVFYSHTLALVLKLISPSVGRSSTVYTLSVYFYRQ